MQDDYSGNFQPLRQQLAAESGNGYLRFVAGLTPRYWRVWLDIGLGYAFLGVILAAVGVPSSLPAQVLASLSGAVAVGYGVAYLQLFLHEAAHYNLAADRQRNDRLCDALISWQVGTTVSRYRPIHFAHHRYLGTRKDTENSYFRAPGPGLLLSTLTGVHALRILAHRERQLGRLPGAAGDRPVASRAALLRGLLLHGLVVAAAFQLSGWPAAAAWVLGVGAFFPVFATLRQLLEHRSLTADPAADYFAEDHGAVTRMFGSDPLASTFGGAGFSRHLLHHWEPQVSCTRLAELEAYLRGTAAAPVMAARQSTYGHTLLALWRARRPALSQ